MKDCCKETYKKTLEEVLGFIAKMPGKSMVELIRTLNYAISMLGENKQKEEVKVYLNESIDKDEIIKRKFDSCKNDDERAKLASKLFTLGIITGGEYLTKYAHWKCWICREMRPDEFISVKVHDMSLEQGFDQEGISLVNVKYCNDREVCKGDAHIKELWLRGSVKDAYDTNKMQAD